MKQITDYENNYELKVLVKVRIKFANHFLLKYILFYEDIIWPLKLERKSDMSPSVVSLFTGAGGLDTGFHQAGYNILVANELMSYACDTFHANYPSTPIISGDVKTHLKDLSDYAGADVVIGGPPCQGFSVAGKMDPDDPRSQLLFTFLDVVSIIKPKVFVMENVKALGTLSKWEPVRKKYFAKCREIGYTCFAHLLNSADFGVSEKRERVIFIGYINEYDDNAFIQELEKLKKQPLTIRQLFKKIPPFGSLGNENTCKAFITMAAHPIMRKDPYAGTLFNGQGRPTRLDGVSQTLPASMGGNKTPIIDQRFLEHPEEGDWVKKRHDEIQKGLYTPKFEWAPDFLRRLTLKEAALIQSFPLDYIFCGSTSSIYTQIGNAVPCGLAKAVAQAVLNFFF